MKITRWEEAGEMFAYCDLPRYWLNRLMITWTPINLAYTVPPAWPWVESDKVYGYACWSTTHQGLEGPTRFNLIQILLANSKKTGSSCWVLKVSVGPERLAQEVRVLATLLSGIQVKSHGYVHRHAVTLEQRVYGWEGTEGIHSISFFGTWIHIYSFKKKDGAWEAEAGVSLEFETSLVYIAVLGQLRLHSPGHIDWPLGLKTCVTTSSPSVSNSNKSCIQCSL